VLGVSLDEFTVAGVNPEFCGRQREDQPALPCIDRGELQNVTEERPIRFGILAVQEKVGSDDHGPVYFVLYIREATPAAGATMKAYENVRGWGVGRNLAGNSGLQSV
jgi:hypothetical protein